MKQSIFTHKDVRNVDNYGYRLAYSKFRAHAILTIQPVVIKIIGFVLRKRGQGRKPQWFDKTRSHNFEGLEN